MAFRVTFIFQKGEAKWTLMEDRQEWARRL